MFAGGLPAYRREVRRLREEGETPLSKSKDSGAPADAHHISLGAWLCLRLDGPVSPNIWQVTGIDGPSPSTTVYGARAKT